MTLENLLRINQLKAEAPDQAEFDGLLRAARVRLADAHNTSLCSESRFDLAYAAAHGLALAALRASGYRTDKRYLVFQCLTYTLGSTAAQVRFLGLCHDKRNLTEYEGHFEIDDELLAGLLAVAEDLSRKVAKIRSESRGAE